ncbi:MAG: type II toxin-antitoxin system VapC family toxin [Bryobacteraceae bacterium]
MTSLVLTSLVETSLVLDTHTAIWYLVLDARLSTEALRTIRAAATAGKRCFVPSICLVEATYLVEKNRIAEATFGLLREALTRGQSNLVLAPLDLAVTRALRNVPRDEVPDLPDRVIAATAVALGLPLITRDGKIRASGIRTVW